MMTSCTSPMHCNVSLPGPSLADLCSASTLVVFMSLLDGMINEIGEISKRYERVRPIETPDDEYDVIVIGGGGGGAVVAGRLAEVPHLKILVLESGSDEPGFGQVPALYTMLLGSAFDYNYTTTGEKYGCLSSNGSCSWPTGKMLGGSTSHNAMKYVRGNPTDYNNWAELGIQGWAWTDVKPFFLLAEDNGDIDEVGRYNHATGGPLPVENPRYVPPFGQSILDASVEAGFGLTDDLNGNKLTGFTVAQTTTKNGVRYSSAAAYLRPVRNNKNLHVSLNTVATKVIIKNKKAVGVEYYKNGEYKTACASKEIVISAGSMRSPHILLHSGIGPKEHLESVGIEVIHDLPGVGQNLHDHVTAVLSYTVNEPDTYENNRQAAAEYADSRSGILSGTGSSSVMAALATNATASDFPDIQMYFKSYMPGCAPGEVDAVRSEGQRTINARVVFLHPKSRGNVSLASNDPLEMPVLWGNFLGESYDRERLVDGIEMLNRLVDTEAMREYNLTLATAPVEACSHLTYQSREYWTCAAGYASDSENHVVGSCKMGPAFDPTAVVDPQLRVHGIKGLRVADASIMPQVTSGNTQAPTMMIGERAAAFIKNDLHRKIVKAPGENNLFAILRQIFTTIFTIH